MLATSLPSLSLTVLGLALASTVCSQGVPNSFPQDYPGKPSGDYSPAWQDYFLVSDPLPNVSFPLSRNWAGSITVNRTNHPNDTLFFWGFESRSGSLTAGADENSSEPWAIWLNGGPGASSILGLLLENGPIHVDVGGSLVPNNESWDKLVDYIWVDQPVGTGYSTAESDGGYIEDEDQMGQDFLNFLNNLVKVFPSLGTRPLLLTGESYAGTYIPYITKAIFSTPNPPVNLNKIAIGNGGMGSESEYEELPALSVIETYPQLIGYDTDVYNYFKEQAHLCGYDFNLTYPQNGKFPPVGPATQPTDEARAAELLSKSAALTRQNLVAIANGTPRPAAGLVRRSHPPSVREVREREHRRSAWKAEKKAMRKRDLTGRANGTIDPYYGCFLTSEVMDYALNFSLPWNLSSEVVIESQDAFGPFNPYNIPDARAPPSILDPTIFLNDNQTRTALHAPTSKNWTLQITYPFNSSEQIAANANPFGDPSVEPVAFFDELASNATERNVSVIIYVGNDDSVVPHFSSEISIQNTTFSGIQGFTRKPSTPFTDDSGNFAGIVHQERNWTYILVANAGHEVPEFAPAVALVILREFILGNNETGLVTNTSGTVSVTGGEGASSLLVGNILPGRVSVLYGSGTATSEFSYPSATIAAWDKFFASAQAADIPAVVAAFCAFYKRKSPIRGCFSGFCSLFSKSGSASRMDRAPVSTSSPDRTKITNEHSLCGTMPCAFSTCDERDLWLLDADEPPPYKCSSGPSIHYRPDVMNVIDETINSLDADLRDLSLKIHDHPETAFKEFYAHDILTEFMRSRGFSVTPHYTGLQTAWKAEWSYGKGGRTLGINSEMDALPGLGHACGHNLIAISGVGVAMAAKAAMEKLKIPGKIILLGTPAEEGGGGKVILLERGVYKEMDICIMCHPSPGAPHTVACGSTFAAQPLMVEYFGHTAHAAMSPWEGQNALDAAVLAYSSISMLRQQIKPDCRVHGIIEGRDWAPNIIPDYAKMRWIIRAPSYLEMSDLVQRVKACIEAAAQAASCRSEISLDYSSDGGIGGASTDFGNVTYALPAMHPSFAIPTVPNGGNHTAEFTKAARTPQAHDAALAVVRGLTLTGIRALDDGAFFKQARVAFDEMVAQVGPTGSSHMRAERAKILRDN
ncbi:hypothetical protein EW145_g733 [Phellinidium pouzarii]|uniref:Peptidase M20 dimerisation domain-containing protein n=1 Tax=Phellinidium pouzarii TaxID=167371 RepID=A0A4S4LHR6_9AGAM|nr:hypothetical protein EW145_g733 [Phellinidium pouzarii]